MNDANPWRNIDAPNAAHLVSARRVNTDLPWDFFWARDVDGRALLTMNHEAASSVDVNLPNLRGIEVSPLSRGRCQQ